MELILVSMWFPCPIHSTEVSMNGTLEAWFHGKSIFTWMITRGSPWLGKPPWDGSTPIVSLCNDHEAAIYSLHHPRFSHIFSRKISQNHIFMGDFDGITTAISPDVWTGYEWSTIHNYWFVCLIFGVPQNYPSNSGEKNVFFWYATTNWTISRIR